MQLDPMTLILALGALIAGIAAGWAHFASLRRVADLFTEGRMSAVALQLGRLAALGVFLWLCTRGGAPVLIAGAVGILIGRAVALKGAEKRGAEWTRH